jgi:hypothetical protein
VLIRKLGDEHGGMPTRSIDRGICMSTTKSPGAVAALGASETDQLGRQVVAEANRHGSLAQAPIPATPVGGNLSEGKGSGDVVGFARLQPARGEFDARFPGRNNADPLFVSQRRLSAGFLERVQP